MDRAFLLFSTFPNFRINKNDGFKCNRIMKKREASKFGLGRAVALTSIPCEAEEVLETREERLWPAVVLNLG